MTDRPRVRGTPARAFAGVVGVICLFPVAAHARQGPESSGGSQRLFPAVVRSDEGWTGGLRWDLGIRRESEEIDLASNWIRPWFFRVGTDGTLTFHSARNPEALRVSAVAGVALRYLDVLEGRDSGLFDLGVKVESTADQRFDQVDAAVSGVVAYVNTLRGAWRLIPSVEATAGGARPLEDLAGEPEWRSRLGVDASWMLPAGELPGISPGLARFTLHLRLRAFRDGGDGGRMAPEEEGVFVAAFLEYAVDRLGGSVFLQRSGGTLPTAEERPRAWSFGLNLPTGWWRGRDP